MIEISSSALGAFDLLPHPVWVFECDSLRIIAANSAACGWLGHDRKTINGVSVLDIRPAEDHAAFRAKVDAFFADDCVDHLPDAGQWRLIPGSGDLRVVRFCWRKVRLDGSPAVLSTFTDLTEQKRVEAKATRLEGEVLRVSERQRLSDDKFRRLFDAAPGQMIVLLPGTHEIVAGTAEFATITGTHPSDLRGRNFFEVFPPIPGEAGRTEMERVRKSLQRVEVTRTADVMPIRSYPIAGSDGVLRDRFWSTINAPVLDDDGNIEFIIHRVLEVTDLVTGDETATDPPSGDDSRTDMVHDLLLRACEIENRLARHDALEAQLRGAEDLLKMGAWEIDLETRRLEWSETVYALYGWPSDKPPPDFDRFLDLIHPEDRSQMVSDFQRFEAEGRKRLVFQHRVVWPDGTIRHMRGVGDRHRFRGQDRIIGAVQDISDMRAAEIRAAEALAQRANILESINEAFFTLDEDWRFSYLNSQAETMLQRSRDSLLGRCIRDEISDYVGSEFEAEYTRVRNDGQSRRFTAYSERLQGWFEVNANAISGGLAVYFRNVTEERAQAEQLRLLGLAVSNLHDMVMVTSAYPLHAPDGPRITFANPAFERMTGYLQHELVGQTPRILQGHETSRAELDRIANAISQGQPVKSELVNYRKDGEKYWVEINITPVRNDLDEVVNFVSIQRDITLHKQVDQERRISDERFRLVASQSSDAIWDLDLRTQKQWWSPGLTEIFGHARDPEERTPTIWQSHIHPDDADAVAASMRQAIETGARTFAFEYRCRMGDGTWALVSDQGVIMRDDAGTPIRLIGSVSNITEKRAREERRLQNQRLEAIGQLTGGVAHDFNNILTVILGNAELLADLLAEDDPARTMAEVTIRAAERGAELTDRLLAFARRQPLDPKVIDLNHHLAKVETLIRRTLPESIEIEVVHFDGLWRTELDPGQMEVALINIALNARDAMPDGGRLIIETANQWLDDAYAANNADVSPGRYVMMSVTDTGHGMDSEALSRAFEPFFSTKEVGKGSGLGLSMVFGFVKQTGGHIKIYSEPGVGTTIRMYFHRAHSQTVTPEDTSYSATPMRGTERILVVEDDMLVRENLCNQLVSLGYKVVAANNGDDALRTLEASADIDLLLTDVVMPGSMYGGVLAKTARTMRPDLRVLFMSGYTENTIVHNGRLDPDVDFLGKPYRLNSLAQKLRSVLDR